MNNFNITRFIKLLQYRISIHKTRWLMQLAGLTGIALLITSLFIKDIARYHAFDNFYGTLLGFSVVFIGVYLSSRAFIELKNTSNGFLYLMLPASTFEKFIIPSLFSGILFFTFYLGVYALLANLSNFIWGLAYHFPMEVYNPLATKSINYTLGGLKAFLILQPIFLLGSVIFKKNHFIATAIVVFVLLILISFISLLSVKIASGEFESINLDVENINIYWIIIFHIIINIATFFKLKEKQI